MPNRVKRAAARQSQLGQRRRKERKERGSTVQPEAVVITTSQAETLIPEPRSDMDTTQNTTQKVSTTATSGTAIPSQPYLRSDLTRVAMVAALSTAIVIGSAVIL